MAYTGTPYGKFGYHLMRGEIACHTADLRLVLVTSSYTFDQDSHEDYGDISGEVAAGAGYTTGGLSLSGVTVTYDTATNRSRLDANDAQWTVPSGQTLTARGAILRKYDATAGNSWFMFYVDFGVDKSASNDFFTVQWDATDGIGYLQP